jgi:hypothetical protein
MSPNVAKTIGSIVAVALVAIGHSGLIPVIPPELFTSLATLLAGWLHFPQPGTAKSA